MAIDLNPPHSASPPPPANMNTTKTIYSLTTEDLNTVAVENLDRKLTRQEIDQITAEIEKRIPWHDIVEDVIREKVGI